MKGEGLMKNLQDGIGGRGQGPTASSPSPKPPSSIPYRGVEGEIEGRAGE